MVKYQKGNKMYNRIIVVLVFMFLFGGFIIPYLLSSNSDSLCYLAFGIIVLMVLGIPKIIKFVIGK